MTNQAALLVQLIIVAWLVCVVLVALIELLIHR